MTMSGCCFVFKTTFKALHGENSPRKRFNMIRIILKKTQTLNRYDMSMRTKEYIGMVIK